VIESKANEEEMEGRTGGVTRFYVTKVAPEFGQK
jgi:hypothetical protein